MRKSALSQYAALAAVSLAAGETVVPRGAAIEVTPEDPEKLAAADYERRQRRIDRMLGVKRKRTAEDEAAIRAAKERRQRRNAKRLKARTAD